MAACKAARPNSPPDPAPVEVLQGALAVSADPGVELVATLGSCVSVCLFSSNAARGGMNHVYRSVGTGTYGQDAVVAEVERLVNALMRLGVARREMSARVIGGAHVLVRGRAHGAAIADACLTYLSTERIPIVGASLGGSRARRLRFHPASGRIAVGLLGELSPQDLPQGPQDRNRPEMF